MIMKMPFIPTASFPFFTGFSGAIALSLLNVETPVAW
jgi:hypothetical protein